MADVSTPLIQQVGGSVGIGTGTPVSKLTVNGSIVAGGASASDTANLALDVQGHMAIRGSNGLYFGVTTNNFNTWTTKLYASGSSQLFNAQTFIFNNEGYGASEFMRLNSSGLGIGTTSPSEKLHINNGTLRIDGTTDGIRIFKDGNDSAVVSHLYLANAANTRAYGWQLNADGSSLNFWTYGGSSWANKLTYKADGNVGIGQTNPAHKLEVSGNALVSKLFVSTANASYDFYNNGTSYLNGTVNTGGNLIVGGNLTVNGTTTTVNSTVTTIDDPIFTLGGDTAPTSDDNKDRGIEFRWHNGTAAKVGFFGFDDSTGYLTFIPDATNTSEVFSGTVGTIQVGEIGRAHV